MFVPDSFECKFPVDIFLGYPVVSFTQLQSFPSVLQIRQLKINTFVSCTFLSNLSIFPYLEHSGKGKLFLAFAICILRHILHYFCQEKMSVIHNTTQLKQYSSNFL